LTIPEYNAQKPTDALPFDCGFSMHFQHL
jgi:hypothetical protein